MGEGGAERERWKPLGLEAALDHFRGAPFRWWISGGHALELFLGRAWRVHGDLDVGFLRGDGARVRAWLADWDLRVTSQGELRPWEGEALSLERGENNVWARRPGRAAWELDLTVGDGDDARWVFRREPTITRPWDRAVLQTEDGTPYLAPELQLLYKARDPRPKDDADVRAVAPHLSNSARRFLGQALPPGHSWLSLLR